MKNYSKKTFRQTIISSVLIIVMSLISMVGGTFAWFTDTETVSSRIVSGKLDVEMYYSNTATDGYENIKTMGEKPLFFVDSEGNDILWEPGVVSVCDLKVENAGNLALQYKLFTEFEDQLNEVAITDDTAKLSEVIKAVILPQTTFADRAAAIAAGEGAEGGWKTLAEIADKGTLEAEDYKEFTVVLYWEPTDNDNDYNMKNDNAGNELSIKVDFNLVATQYTSELDAFDKYYDVIEDSKPSIADIFTAMSDALASGDAVTDPTKLPAEIFVVEATTLAPGKVKVGDREDILAPEIDGAETTINLKNTMSIGNNYKDMDQWGGLRVQGQSGRTSTVTFKGDENGLFTNKDSNVKALIYVEGKFALTIESGVYETKQQIFSANMMLSETQTQVINISGGSFKFIGADKDHLVSFSSTKAEATAFIAQHGMPTFNITGGKFYNCNPTGYVAAGYKVVSSEAGNDIIYEVVAE